MNNIIPLAAAVIQDHSLSNHSNCDNTCDNTYGDVIETYTKNIPVFEGIVVSGGGNKGMVSIGALCYYYNKGLYDPIHVKVYAGTSIGAIIVTLLSCGYTPPELFTRMSSDPTMFNIEDVTHFYDILKVDGLISNRTLIAKMREMVIEKLRFVPTFKELYEMTGKKLIVTVTNVTQARCEYYSYKTKPDMDVVMASAGLSSNLPLIFSKVTENGDNIVDGGLMDNFPVREIDDGKIKILGILTVGEERSSGWHVPTKLDGINYVYKLMRLPSVSNVALRSESVGDNVEVVKLRWAGTMLKMAMDTQEIEDMFLKGYHLAEYRHSARYFSICEWT